MNDPPRDGEKGGRLWWQARRDRALRLKAWGLRTRQIERTAYHEAGHAVMARCAGLRVEYLTIRPDPEMNLLGSVEYRRVRSSKSGSFEVPASSKGARRLKIKERTPISM